MYVQEEESNSTSMGHGSSLSKIKKFTLSKRRKLNHEENESSPIEINSSSSENDGDGTSSFSELNRTSNPHKKFSHENSANDSFDLFLPSRVGKHTHPLISSASQNIFNMNRSRVIKKKNSCLEESSANGKRCPVCLKTYDSLCIHLKSCAKKNEESFNKLGITLAFEKESPEAENDADPFQFVGRPASAKMFERDIQRAIKLSLEDSNISKCGDTLLKEENVAVKKSEPKRTGKISKLSGKPLLLRRTKEERQNIITEKVAIVLMDSDKKCEETFTNENFNLKSSLLRHCLCEEALLWKKSRLPPSDVKDDDFYIPSMTVFSSANCESHKKQLEYDKQHSESEPVV